MEIIQIDPAQIDLLISSMLVIAMSLAFCMGFSANESSAK